jgi:hypothetical protein
MELLTLVDLVLGWHAAPSGSRLVLRAVVA